MLYNCVYTKEGVGMMQRTDLLPYQRITNTKKIQHQGRDKKIFMKSFSFKNLITDFSGFMLARAAILSGLTPFGLPFYAAAFDGKIGTLFIGLSVIIGLFSANTGLLALKYIAAMLLFTLSMMLIKSKLLKNTFFIALMAFNSLFISGIISVISQGLLLYDIFMLLFECFICFVMVYILKTAMPVLQQKTERRVMANEEIISLSILMGLIILGLNEINLPGGISLKNILSIFILLAFSLKHGIGVAASAGVTLGLINSMASPGMYYMIGSYAFGGLISGVFKSFGKIGVCLGFLLANAIMTIYMNGSTEVLINIYDIFIAALMLAVVPEKYLDYIGKFLNKTAKDGIIKKTYSLRIKEVTADKLNSISKSFEQLACTFDSIAEKRKTVNNNDVAVLFDQVAERICKDCGLCFCCWGKEFHSTYQIMFKILEKLEEKGHIDERDVPDFFASRCIRLPDFVNATNNLFEIYKMNLIWHNKVGESRGLISQQLKGVSKIIRNLANEISIDLNFDEGMEEELMIELDKAGIIAKDVTVLQNSSGKYEVDVVFRSCGGVRNCVKAAAPVISQVLGRKMMKEESGCSLDRYGSKCSVKYIEEQMFQVSSGIARIKKQGQQEYGDNYTFMQLKDGRFVLALSDGMGSGKRAARESSTTISLLEQLLDSGFDKDTAVKLINSVLILKSPEETFATMDISIIDLYTGNVEFVKIGASSTFIKKPDRIEVIKSTSLPAGILNNIDMELSNKKVNDGDFIIMMTDGVLDSKGEEIKKEEWVREVLRETDTINPQEMADRILQTAIQNAGNYIGDDMTVLVAKIWKKI